MASTNEREWGTHINALSTAFMKSHVLFAANAAGVFALLEEPRGASEIAQRVGWDARAARILLDALVSLELIAQTGGLYRNAPIASACLVPGKTGYQGNIVNHISNTVNQWVHVDETLRTGKALHGERHQRTPEELRAFILGMNDIGRTSAREMLDVIDLSSFRNLLDVGGGPATYTIAFLAAHPAMRGTVFDRPDVLAIAREQVHEAGLDGRVSYAAGDLTTDPLGSGYDLILVSNIIHSYSSDTNGALVRKCFDALDSGGTLIIKDFLTENDRSGPAFSLMFALRMLLANGEGDTYSFADIESWTQAAGFADGRVVDLTPQTRLWVVRKP
ncbi:MAG: methyltransferase domain-containing protein [Candidatus Hydrogenedentes bacterium]|nr:methyltransferase domain-containing protein [Candidatus Hydrogenedentota bacterium]